MVDDKDLHAVMSMLPDDAAYYWTQPSTRRAFPAEKVAATAAGYGLHGETFLTVPEAYRAALHAADKDDFIFVGGSSYVVADLRAASGTGSHKSDEAQQEHERTKTHKGSKET